MLRLALLLVLVGCTPRQVAAPAPPRRTVEHVIVVSVDGLKPESYLRADELGLKVPLFREMLARGAHAAGVRSVYPTVTYPAHTSMVTGVDPRRHGIVSNLAFDPMDNNLGGWRWYAEEIAAPTIYDAVQAAGGKVGLLFWPVSVGARVDFLVPEVWRASNREDQRLIRALSTPGLLDAVEKVHPDLWRKITPQHTRDAGTIDVATWLIEHERPNLIMAHIFETDDAQHNFGPGTPQAYAAIEHADRQVNRLVEAARRAGTWERTVLIVVSDHGFLPVNRVFRPRVLLRGLGLGATGWEAGVLCSGGQAYVYLEDPSDRATAERIETAFRALAPGSGVKRVLGRDEIVARGGDGSAFLSLEAEEGTYFSIGAGGELTSGGGARGHHGFDPEHPEMQASLLVYGAGVTAGRKLEGVRLIDVAPTIAALLGVQLSGASGKALPL